MARRARNADASSLGFMERSFQGILSWRTGEPAGPGPAIPLRGKKAVDDRDERREGGQRPDQAVGPEQTVLDVPPPERHQESEQDPPGARVGGGLRIRDHEEGEEEKGAALQTMHRDGERL